MALNAGPLVISEFLAVNDSIQTDEDGDYSDWIEIHNPTDTTVLLDGWYLTDDASDPTKWRFPDGTGTLPQDGHRLIFASNKDRTVPGRELHTNFKLRGSGEYLALVQPNGVTVAHGFTPTYPEQYSNIAYGLTQNATELVAEGGSMSFLVPSAQEATIGTDWTEVAFDDTSWTSVSQPPPVSITEISMASDDWVEVQNLAGFEVDTTGWTLVANDSSAGIDAAEPIAWPLPSVLEINEVLYATDEPEDTAAGAHYWGGDLDWRIYGKGWVMLLDAGGHLADFVAWNYAEEDIATMNVEVDGRRITVGDAWAGPTVPKNTGRTNTLQRSGQADHNNAMDWEFTVPSSAAVQNAEITPPFPMHVSTGIGYVSEPGAFGGVVGIDVGAEMQDVNSSLWIRIPFEVEDPSALDTMRLRMQYNDGFVAYLNGHQVARRNAPDVLSWDAAATVARSVEDSLLSEEIDISDRLDVLAAGDNVLAFHALNSSADDTEFLLHPGLVATGLRYFTTPTPRTANTPGVLDVAREVEASVERGFFETPFTVTLSTELPDTIIRYTTDGSEPTETTGSRYIDPILIDTTTVLRAAAFKEGFARSNVMTQSYLFLDDVIHQPISPAGFPMSWTNRSADYEMDPFIVDNPVYGDRIKEALRSLPTMSLSISNYDLFDPTHGIYSNSTAQSNDGRWERAVSVELFDFPDDAEIQVDGGLRLTGKASRGASRPKHNMRLVFRAEYGPGKLEFPLFKDTEVKSFNSVILRGGNGDSYVNPAVYNRAMYIRDQWHRDAQVAMGQFTSAQDYVHLYINGLYWGMYHTIERVEDDLFVEHFGGEKEDWDVIKDQSGQSPVEVVDGSSDAWNQVLSLANAGMANANNYKAIQEYLDFDTLIDYILVNFYSANNDWDHNNWRAARRREPGATFMFLSWDAERTDINGLGSSTNQASPITVNVTGANKANRTTRVHQSLTANVEYRMRFADRIHRHFFNGGTLSPEGATALWNARADQIRLAMYAESARWGDAHASSARTPDHWEANLQTMNTTFLALRTDIVLEQLKARNLYPDVVAPSFSQHGGQIEPTVPLSITSPTGTLYYTIDGSDPRLPGGALSPTALAYTGAPLFLNRSAVVMARVLDGVDWSALNEAQFYVGTSASAENLAISEIHYHPSDPRVEELNTDASFTDDSFEFVELMNIGTEPIDLTGVEFTKGIKFTFDSSFGPLEPGQRAVIAGDIEGFEARYGPILGNTTTVLAGAFEGQLDDNGETLALTDRFDTPIVTFSYNDSGNWPDRADGRGASLELIDSGALPDDFEARTDFLEDGAHWRSSGEFGGTPGSAGIGPVTDIVINEVLARSTEGAFDAIELHNTTETPIDVGGWFLSNSGRLLDKFHIPGNNPAATTIEPGGYVVFDESHFNPEPANPGPSSFVLDGERGGDVWLTQGDEQGRLLRFADHIEFSATTLGESHGRWPDGSGRFAPMSEVTLGSENAAPRVGPLFISEVMYHPVDPGPGVDADNVEFVEIYNPLFQPVALAGWALRGGIDFDFAAETTIAPHSTLVILPFDPSSSSGSAKWATFSDYYGLMIEDSVAFFGAYSGRLANGGDTVRLERAGTPPADDPDLMPGLIEDEVRYDDTPPWPFFADGFGHSLQRRDGGTWGSESTNWKSAIPTPGRTDYAVSPEVVGRYVFYNDSVFDGHDETMNSRDDYAIATDKTALLPGGKASSTNFTSFASGVNGIMVDVVGLAEAESLDVATDFSFRVGNSEDLTIWTDVVSPNIDVRIGDGVAGSDRIVLTWPNATVTNTWLEVTLLDTRHTGLPIPDVFYFGNLIGETGNEAGVATVTSADEVLVRANRRGLDSRAAIDNPYDLNRDGLVNVADRLISRNHRADLPDGLRLIATESIGGLTKPQESGTDSLERNNQPNLDWISALTGPPENVSDEARRRTAVDRLFMHYGE